VSYTIDYTARTPDKAVESDIARCEIFIFALGYEERSIYIAQNITQPSQRRIAVGFGSRQVLSFSANLSWAIESGIEYREVKDEEFLSWCSDMVSMLDGTHTVAFDVSSFNRDRLGPLLRALMAWLRGRRENELVICYAPASFSSISAASIANGSLLGSAELLPGFEGDFVDPSQALTAIVGLGYEPGRALGSIELIEAPLVTVFLPYGVDEKYDAALIAANAGLTERTSRVSVARYNVLAPWELYDELYRLVWGLSLQGRSTIVPLGPKIFCAVACLVANELAVSPPIWRVSAGSEELAIDCQAAGPVCALLVYGS
jgi:hypothetical protein